MAGAKKRLLTYFLQNVGQVISRDTLSIEANVHDWQRTIRTLRKEGWEIESTNDGYILHSDKKKDNTNARININAKLRYSILQRDNSTCQRCGRTPKDGIKLHVDHKLPVDLGGTNDPENLWTMCEECNGGKKNFFSDFEPELLKAVLKETSGYQKLVKLFQLSPNVVFEPIKLQGISGIRDWTRTIRLIREKEKLDITWIERCEDFPYGGYMSKSK